MLQAAEHEVASLIDQVADHLHYNILHAPGELKGIAPVRITQQTAVDARGCWELFGSLLDHKGLALLPLDVERGFCEVVSMPGPRARDIADAAVLVRPDEVEAYTRQKATPILTAVPLQHIDAITATNALRPFFASSGGTPGLTFATTGNNSTLLVQGFGPQVAAACRMLALADTANDTGAGRAKVVRLQHVQAQEVVATLDSVMGQSIRATVAAEAGMPLQRVGAMLRALAYPTLNAVILTGGATQMAEAQLLIDALDQPALAGAAARPARRVEAAAAVESASRASRWRGASGLVRARWPRALRTTSRGVSRCARPRASPCRSARRVRDSGLRSIR